MNHSRSSQLFQQAKASIPGGVNSPVRAFKSVGADPLFINPAAQDYRLSLGSPASDAGLDSALPAG